MNNEQKLRTFNNNKHLPHESATDLDRFCIMTGLTRSEVIAFDEAVQ